MKPTLLVTGASGFLGWHLCQLAEADWRVVGCAFTHELNLPGIDVRQCDLSSSSALEALFEQARPDAVIHAAALSKPDLCQQDPERSYRINVEASLAIARLCQQAEIRCVFTSTDLVFDGTRAPYGEQAPTAPVSIYGEHKVLAERRMREIYPQLTCCRLPLMYGLPSPFASGFLAPWIAALQQSRPLHLFVDEYRTPVNAHTAAKGLLLAIEHPGRLLHLGGRRRISRYELGRILAKELGASEDLLIPGRQDEADLPAPRPPDVSLDSSLAFSLGYDPPDLEQDLAQLLQVWPS